MFVVKLVSLLRHIDIYNGKLRRCRWWAVSSGSLWADIFNWAVSTVELTAVKTALRHDSHWIRPRPHRRINGCKCHVSAGTVSDSEIQRFCHIRIYGRYLVQCCNLYGNATHIANTRYRTCLGKKGRIWPALVTIKYSQRFNKTVTL